MLRPTLGACTLLATICFVISTSCAADSKTMGQIYEENRMAVVHVVMKADPSNSNQEPSSGTGFIIGGDGYVLTAKHIISEYKNEAVTPITVRIGSLNGIEVEAEPIPFDIGIDVALLRLRNPIGLGLRAYRNTARGDSRKIKGGDTLFLAGFNFTSNYAAFPATLSSNLGGGIGGNLLWSVIGAGALFGMSGAPVFDETGSVVGIVKGGQPGTSILQIIPEELLENFAIIPGWRRTETTLPPPVDMGNAIVMDGNVNYGQSGFSLSRNLVVSWDSPDADILVATAGAGAAEFFLPYDVPPYSSPHDATARSGIREMGTGDFATIASCSSLEYQFHWMVAKQGGVYCVRTRSGNRFAKLKVTGVYKDRISFDWAILN
jgi:Trypsin-like peptidase domain